MAVRADHSPWYKPVKETTLTGKQKRQLSSNGMQWDLSGWHTTRKRGWISAGKKSNQIELVERTTADGRKVKVYQTHGYDDYIGFHAHDAQDVDQNAIEFAMKSLDSERVHKTAGCGHIAQLEYSPEAQVLRVTFANGGICLFFRIPTAVVGELLSLAEKGSVRKDGKHLLGIRFWDLVRIRGQRHGARYPFEYEKKTNYKLTRSSARYDVTLDAEHAKAIGVLVGRELKAGAKIRTVLTEEEMANLFEYEQTHGKSSIVHSKASSLTEDKEDGEKNTVKAGSVDINKAGVDQDFYSDSSLGHELKDSKLFHQMTDAEIERYKELTKKYVAYKEKKAAENKDIAERSVTPKMDQRAFDKRVKELQQQALTDKDLQLKTSIRNEDETRYYNTHDISLQKYDKLRKKEEFSHVDEEGFLIDVNGERMSYHPVLFKKGTPDYVKIAKMAADEFRTSEKINTSESPYYDQRATRNPKIKDSLVDTDIMRVKLEDVFPNRNDRLDYIRLNRLHNMEQNPMHYAIKGGKFSVGWTVQDLKDYGNPSVPGNVPLSKAATYKNLLKKGNYQAALDMIIDISMHAKDPSAKKAGPNDFLIL